MQTGDVLPEQTYTVTRADLVRYAGASGDFNPIHWSERVATTVGLPGVIAHGMFTMALAARALDTWAGAPGRVRELGCKFTKPVVVPDDDTGVTVTRAGHGHPGHRGRRPRRPRGHLRRGEGARPAPGGAGCLSRHCWPTSPPCGSAGRRAPSSRRPPPTSSSTRSVPPMTPGTPSCWSPAAATSSSPTRGSPAPSCASPPAASTVEEDTCGGAFVKVAAGEVWDDLVALAVERGWLGVEALSGIPGSVGATPVQNVGAYGQEVAETIASVRCWDREEGVVRTLAAADCGFGYRTSRFKREPERFVVLEVTFQLRLGDLGAPVRYAELARSLGVEAGGRAPTSQVRETVLGLRRGKGMVLDPADHDTWSAGSFFTNPVLPADQAARLPDDAPRWRQPDGSVKTSAAWLIERAGFAKGHGNERVGLSTKHTLALTNRGGGVDRRPARARCRGAGRGDGEVRDLAGERAGARRLRAAPARRRPPRAAVPPPIPTPSRSGRGRTARAGPASAARRAGAARWRSRR